MVSATEIMMTVDGAIASADKAMREKHWFIHWEDFRCVAVYERREGEGAQYLVICRQGDNRPFEVWLRNRIEAAFPGIDVEVRALW